MSGKEKELYKRLIKKKKIVLDMWLPRGWGWVGKGRTGSLGLADANYYT